MPTVEHARRPLAAAWLPLLRTTGSPWPPPAVQAGDPAVQAGDPANVVDLLLALREG